MEINTRRLKTSWQSSGKKQREGKTIAETSVGRNKKIGMKRIVRQEDLSQRRRELAFL